MIQSLLYATKDLLSDIGSSVVVYLESVKYIVTDCFAKEESFVDEVFTEAPKKKRGKKKKSK
jgi:hypothetical protein